MLDAAAAAGVRVAARPTRCSAPATQTARAAIDAGLIGAPDRGDRRR